MIVVLGICFAVASFSYYQARDVEVYLPWLWPAWLACAAVACFAFALRLDSAALWQTSRVFVVIGTGSRVVSILTRAVEGTLPNGWSGLGGGAIYFGAAVAFHRLWSVDFRYWSRRASSG